jgi:hypothetical protein
VRRITQSVVSRRALSHCHSFRLLSPSSLFPRRSTQRRAPSVVARDGLKQPVLVPQPVRCSLLHKLVRLRPQRQVRRPRFRREPAALRTLLLVFGLQPWPQGRHPPRPQPSSLSPPPQHGHQAIVRHRRLQQPRLPSIPCSTTRIRQQELLEEGLSAFSIHRKMVV